jgi:branched-chain amino acid transport system ATP-binding protein
MRGPGSASAVPQNFALFHHMSVLDNIMVGRHHLLKNNFITGSLCWLTGAWREELEHRRKSRRSSIS